MKVLLYAALGLMAAVNGSVMVGGAVWLVWDAHRRSRADAR